MVMESREGFHNIDKRYVPGGRRRRPGRTQKASRKDAESVPEGRRRRPGRTQKASRKDAEGVREGRRFIRIRGEQRSKAGLVTGVKS